LRHRILLECGFDPTETSSLIGLCGNLETVKALGIDPRRRCSGATPSVLWGPPWAHDRTAVRKPQYPCRWIGGEEAVEQPVGIIGDTFQMVTANCGR
jgi:hypothetical protein